MSFCVFIVVPLCDVQFSTFSVYIMPCHRPMSLEWLLCIVYSWCIVSLCVVITLLLLCKLFSIYMWVRCVFERRVAS